MGVITIDIAGSLISGLAVEAFVGAARTLQSRTPWGHDRYNIAQLRRRFEPTADRVALSLAVKLDKSHLTSVQQSEIAALLRRSEAKSLLRGIMLVHLTGQESQYKGDLTAQLVSLLSLLTSLNHSSSQIAGQVIYEEFAQAFEQLVEDTSADEKTFALLRDEAWNQLLLESLRNLNQVTKFYNSYTLNDLRAFENFERGYRSQVRSRYRFIVPPHLESVQRVQINNLFVQPNLKRVVLSDPTGSSDELVSDTGEFRPKEAGNCSGRYRGW